MLCPPISAFTVGAFGLPEDIAKLIIQRLHPRDAIRLKATCSYWRCRLRPLIVLRMGAKNVESADAADTLLGAVPAHCRHLVLCFTDMHITGLLTRVFESGIWPTHLETITFIPASKQAEDKAVIDNGIYVVTSEILTALQLASPHCQWLWYLPGRALCSSPAAWPFGQFSGSLNWQPGASCLLHMDIKVLCFHTSPLLGIERIFLTKQGSTCGSLLDDITVVDELAHAGLSRTKKWMGPLRRWLVQRHASLSDFGLEVTMFYRDCPCIVSSNLKEEIFQEVAQMQSSFCLGMVSSSM